MEDEPQLPTHQRIQLRFRGKDDALVFYLSGQPRRGVADCDDTRELKALLTRVFAQSKAMEVEL